MACTAAITSLQRPPAPAAATAADSTVSTASLVTLLPTLSSAPVGVLRAVTSREPGNMLLTLSCPLVCC